MPSTRQVSYLGLILVFLGALFYCYEYFLRIAPSVMQIDLMHYFNLNATLFGSLSAFYFYAYTPMQLLVGVAVDRYPLRNVMTFAILSCALGSLLFASTSHYELAALGRFLQGFGSAFAFVGALKLASKWLPVWWFAGFSGFCTSLGFLGGALGDIILTDWVQTMGWQKLIQIFVVSGFVLALIFWVFMSLRPKSGSLFDSENNQTQLSLGGAFLQLWALIKQPYLWGAGILGGLLFLPTIVFADLWGIPYLQKLHGYSLTEAGLVTAMIYFGWALGSPFQGIISNLFKKRMRVLFWGALLAGILSLVALYTPSLPYFVLCGVFFLFGMASSSEVIVFAMGRDVCTRQTTGMAMAFINFLVMISGLFMQRGVGMVLDFTWSGGLEGGLRVYSLHDYQLAIAIVPVSLFLVSILTLFIKDKQLLLKEE